MLPRLRSLALAFALLPFSGLAQTIVDTKGQADPTAYSAGNPTILTIAGGSASGGGFIATRPHRFHHVLS